MKTNNDMRVWLEEVIRDIHARPYLYGPLLIEIETWLNSTHWMWAELTEKRPELEAAKTEATPEGRRSATGSFCRVFDLISPQGDESAKSTYVLNSWKGISKRLGILTEVNQDSDAAD